jgi:glucosamine kinase
VSWLLGIDIGGSTSRARLVCDGVVVQEAESASASVTASGKAAATEALAGLLRQLPQLPGTPLDAICVGTAGHTAAGSSGFLRARLAPLTRNGAVLIVDDAALVLPAAGLADGIAVVCGTGSIAVGQCRERSARAGGWGYLLGDEGSGYWIVRASIRVLLGRRDRGEPAGRLGDRLLAATGQPSLPALLAAFYRGRAPGNWASHATAVLDCDDTAAEQIRNDAAMALARLATDVAGQLAAPAGLPVVLAGGLLAHPALQAAVLETVARALPGSRPEPLVQPPVAGAVQLAAAAAASRRLPQ